MWGRSSWRLLLSHRKVELCEFKSIKGIGKEKGDKQYLVSIVLMQFRMNLDPKIARPNTEVATCHEN